MKIVLITVLVFFYPVFCFAQITIPSDIRAKITEFSAASYGKRNTIARRMTNSERQEFLKWVQVWAINEGIGDEAKVMRIQLGDEDPMREFAARVVRNSSDLEAGDALGSIELCENPYLIGLIAPALFIEENLLEDRRWYTSTSTSEAIRKMLSNTPGFSGEVISWARNNANFGLGVEQLYILRQWWTENEQHFQDRDYQAVTPGPATIMLPDSIKVPDGVQLQKCPKAASTTNATPLNDGEPPPALPQPRFPPTPTAASTESAPSPAFLTISLCALLLATGLWLAARRDKTPS